MAIAVGDSCPHFVLPDQNGEQFDIASVLGKKNLVIYFYPKDETGGCTAEACAFRDNYSSFEELDCEVIGISSDSIQSHERFATRLQLNFRLLADEKKTVRNLFGVPRNLFGLISGRVTYIVDKSGIVRHVHNSLTDPESHITAARNSILSLNSAL